jgi:anti-sigma B factor antagonist
MIVDARGSRDRRIDTAHAAESDNDVSPVVPHFELSEEDSASGTHVINVSGEIHVQTAPRFAQRLSEAIDKGNTTIVLDLSAVEFIDSTGLSVLLSGLRQVVAAQGRMALVCANPTVLRLFQITSLDETFDIFPGRVQAFAHVQRGAGGSSSGAP